MKGFLGYYVKCQSESETVSIIFGKSQDKSFIQIITKDDSHFVEFDSSECQFRKRNFDIRVHNNAVDENGMVLSVENDNLTVQGEIKFGSFTRLRGERKRWKSRPGSSIMGVFRYLPFMECRHMIVSMNHQVSGQITINGKIYDFSNGTGYIEGDSGKSFPRKYFWTQASTGGTIVSASVARIPYFGIRFTGTICVIRFENREFRLATYLGARIKKFDRTGIIIKQGKLKLTIDVLDNKNSHPLLAPVRGKLCRIIHESIKCSLRYRFSRKNKILFDFTTDHAAYEFSDI